MFKNKDSQLSSSMNRNIDSDDKIKQLPDKEANAFDENAITKDISHNQENKNSPEYPNLFLSSDSNDGECNTKKKVAFNTINGDRNIEMNSTAIQTDKVWIITADEYQTFQNVIHKNDTNTSPVIEQTNSNDIVIVDNEHRHEEVLNQSENNQTQNVIKAGQAEISKTKTRQSNTEIDEMKTLLSQHMRHLQKFQQTFQLACQLSYAQQQDGRQLHGTPQSKDLILLTQEKSMNNKNSNQRQNVGSPIVNVPVARQEASCVFTEIIQTPQRKVNDSSGNKNIRCGRRHHPYLNQNCDVVGPQRPGNRNDFNNNLITPQQHQPE